MSAHQNFSKCDTGALALTGFIPVVTSNAGQCESEAVTEAANRVTPRHIIMFDTDLLNNVAMLWYYPLLCYDIGLLNSTTIV